MDCLTDDSNSPQANGDINQRPRVCQAVLARFMIYPEIKKRRNLLAIFAGEATLKVTEKFPVLKPLDAPHEGGMGIIGTKIYLSIPSWHSQSKFNLACVRYHVFKGETLDAS